VLTVMYLRVSTAAATWVAGAKRDPLAARLGKQRRGRALASWSPYRASASRPM